MPCRNASPWWHACSRHQKNPVVVCAFRRVRLIAAELWFMSCMLCGVILPSAPTVASTLGALSAKLETFKRMQTCAHKPKLLCFFSCLNETKTKSWTAFRGNPLRLQGATICSFASEMISGIYLITFVCCQSPHRVQLVLDRRRWSRARGCGRDADLQTLRAQIERPKPD